MKTIFWHCMKWQRAMLVMLILAMLPVFSFIGLSRAAGLAEEHTVLYYLIEMQRRLKKDCGSASLPEAPSLQPSVSLRALAEQSAASDQSPEAFANANGLGGIPFFATSIPAQSAQEAFDRIKAAQCPNLMGREYHYVGAAKANGQWTLFLAGAEPGGTPAIASGAEAEGGVPGTRESAGTSSSRTSVEPVQTHAPGKGKAISPSVATRPARSGKVPAAGPSADLPETRPGYDPRPAPAVPVAEVPVDGLGRPLGKPVPISPSVSQGGAPLSAPGEALPSGTAVGTPKAGVSPAPIHVPPGGAGPVDDPSAPAAPVIVQEFTISPTGEILGPADSGSRAPAAPFSPDRREGSSTERFSPPVAPEPQSAVSRQGVVPLHDEGLPAHPDGQGILFSGQTASTAESRMDGPAVFSGEGKQLFASLNQARSAGATCGGSRQSPAPSLRANATLIAVAQAQADAMAENGYFSSTSPQGQTLGQRVSASGYVWNFVAENIARTGSSADTALQSWMNNAGQCRNLMSSEYTDVGIGYNDMDGLWVLTLASPAQEKASRP